METVHYSSTHAPLSSSYLCPSGMTFNSNSDSVRVIYLATKGAAGRLEDGKQCKQSAAEDTIRPLFQWAAGGGGGVYANNYQGSQSRMTVVHNLPLGLTSSGAHWGLPPKYYLCLFIISVFIVVMNRLGPSWRHHTFSVFGGWSIDRGSPVLRAERKPAWQCSRVCPEGAVTSFYCTFLFCTWQNRQLFSPEAEYHTLLL